MSVVKVSSKYQIVIPREIREPMGIKPGQEVAVLRFGERIEVIPLEPMKEMRGFLSGIPGLDSRVDREQDRDL